jgi:hypothetical protein
MAVLSEDIEYYFKLQQTASIKMERANAQADQHELRGRMKAKFVEQRIDLAAVLPEGIKSVEVEQAASVKSERASIQVDHAASVRRVEHQIKSVESTVSQVQANQASMGRASMGRKVTSIEAELGIVQATGAEQEHSYNQQIVSLASTIAVTPDDGDEPGPKRSRSTLRW